MPLSDTLNGPGISNVQVKWGGGGWPEGKEKRYPWTTSAEFPQCLSMVVEICNWNTS